MSDNIVIRILLRHYWKKSYSAARATREICEVEGDSFVSERTAQKWFKRFKEGETDVKDKQRCGRPRTIDEEMLETAVKENPNFSSRVLADDFNVSQSAVVQHLHNLGFLSRRPHIIPHDLTPEIEQKRVDMCQQLLQNPTGDRFWCRIVTSDEKWIFLRNPNMKRQWSRQSEARSTVVQHSRFDRKVMLCVVEFRRNRILGTHSRWSSGQRSVVR